MMYTNVCCEYVCTHYNLRRQVPYLHILQYVHTYFLCNDACRIGVGAGRVHSLVTLLSPLLRQIQLHHPQQTTLIIIQSYSTFVHDLRLFPPSCVVAGADRTINRDNSQVWYDVCSIQGLDTLCSFLFDKESHDRNMESKVQDIQRCLVPFLPPHNRACRFPIPIILKNAWGGSSKVFKFENERSCKNPPRQNKQHKNGYWRDKII